MGETAQAVSWAWWQRRPRTEPGAQPTKAGAEEKNCVKGRERYVWEERNCVILWLKGLGWLFTVLRIKLKLTSSFTVRPVDMSMNEGHPTPRVPCLSLYACPWNAHRHIHKCPLSSILCHSTPSPSLKNSHPHPTGLGNSAPSFRSHSDVTLPGVFL